MKNIFTGLVIIVSTTLFGQVTILEENFDGTSLPSTWTTIDNDGHTLGQTVQEYTSAWIHKEDPLNPGNGTASSTSFFDPVDRADRWLITPQLSLGATGNFVSWTSLSQDPSFPDSYKVMISTTGNSIADFKDTLVVVSNETPYWSSHTESLESYVNKDIYIAYVNTTFDGFKLFIDSVYVREQDPLSIAENEIIVGVYPNPIANDIHISTASPIIQNAVIYNSYGQEVISANPSTVKSELKIDASHLNSGVYFISIFTEEGVVRRKVVK
ncbi:MAG TPA: choice-of-anchor J domain-containing protein [Brumimicrobium sp.]|nr:choice-of-anchor J domain-containing protein [Brumimicrobium sp.]